MTHRNQLTRIGRWSIFILLLGLISLPCASGEPGEVLLSFAAPTDKPCDLSWDGSTLWLLDNESHKLYELHPVNGELLSELDTSTPDPCGLTWTGDEIWLCDSSTLQIGRLDREANLMIDQISVPCMATSTCKASALAWDGEYLWSGTVAGWSSRVSQVDTVTGEVRRSFFTSGYPDALETDGSLIWTASHNGGDNPGLIYQYSFQDGVYLSHFTTPGKKPTGLAFDGESLWCVDSETRTIYRLALN